MKRIFFLAIFLLFVGGCSNSSLKSNYDNMQVSDKGINGYSLYLSVSGKVGDERINKIIKIDNYKDQEYKITEIDANIIEEDGQNKEDISYVLNGKLYVENNEGKYIEDTKNAKFNNPAIYLEGLKNVTEASDPKETVLGEIAYDVYDVTFGEESIRKIIDDLEIKGIELKEDVKGQIYIDEDGYTKNIIYNIDDLKINVIYYKVNKATEIAFPTEIR